MSSLPIEQSILKQACDQIAAAQVDDGDIFIERSHAASISLEEGRVKHLACSRKQGVGIRLIKGEACGHACTDRLEGQAILETVKAARAIASEGGCLRPVHVHAAPIRSRLYPDTDPAASISWEERKRLLKHIDDLARSLDSRIVQVFASLAFSFSDIHIIRRNGEWRHDRRPLVRLNVSVIAEDGGRRETGSAGGGGRFALTELLDIGGAEHYVREAVRIALLNLEAEEAPAGAMPVVLGPGWPGILLHEAVGHGLEGDFNRKGTSVFAGRLGKRVAAPGVTVIDDGTLPRRRGSLNIDDEGSPSQRTVLIEDGILTGYLLDRQNARLMGMKSTGNGRRESYADPVLPRMTNTFMLAGKTDPSSIVSSLDRGIYAVNFGGGQVDITSGKFVFTTSEAYYVENGQIQFPVKGATLIGSGHEVLKKVSMVGNDLALDPGVGTCGKAGQNVPVGVGLPTIRIDELVVGGTKVQ
ncbi:MAG: metalloprotease TldD [Zetaproteobacteria bacterium]|nr:MAG: metalloprotease TldD [Zetaproteobacteria bacterium]